MRKVIYTSLILIAIGFAIFVIFSIYWPFAKGFITEKRTVGDALMHLANIISIKRYHPFPILAWKSEWAGYPLIEGYPWLHYYLIQSVLPFFESPGLAMDYYMAVFLLVYYIAAFLLLFYVSRNVFLALLFSLVLIYGADSHMPLSVNAFMTFAASQFFLPLIILLIIIAKAKNNSKLLLLSSIILAISFYAHGSMTGVVVLPLIFPFLILNSEGKISKNSIFSTARFFLAFAFISAVQIYQLIDYNSQGYLRGVKSFPLDIIPSRFAGLMSWENPVLLPLLIIFIPLFIAARKSFSRIKPYLFSLIFIVFIFTLMLFNITSMNLVLLAERVLWGINLSFLLLFSIVIAQLTHSSRKKQIIAGAISCVLVSTYLFFTLVIKPPHLVPDTLRDLDPYRYHADKEDEIAAKLSRAKYSTKYDVVYSYPPLPWNQSFDNYRTDGLSYNIYSNWNIWSSNPRYKGRFPAAKRLPLEWSGLVNAAEYGKLGEAGSVDSSKWAINQSLFFFDWYAIRHFEIAENDFELADFLRKEPLITSTNKSLDLVYHNLDKKYVGPIYAPTNAKTIAVISPEIQYDNFIRTLSYSEFTSKKLIPIYLGSNLGSLNDKNLKYFDAVFLYGYKKPLFGSAIWNTLGDYVKEGGKLMIETGQKVDETESSSLPEVFPVAKTKMVVVDKSWNVEIKENDLTKDVQPDDFSPLKTKYLPYSISETNLESLKDWAKPVLVKNGSVILAFGQLGKGSVVWSGLNLPFHAIDNRNTSETVIFANILKWFFPREEVPIEDFQVSHPTPGNIVVKSSYGKGVLLKENYNLGWNAKLNGKKAEILKAGLFEMYIPFDSKEGEQLAELNYYGNPLHWLLFMVSFVSGAVVIIYLVFNINPLFWIKKLLKTVVKVEEEDY